MAETRRRTLENTRTHLDTLFNLQTPISLNLESKKKKSNVNFPFQKNTKILRWFSDYGDHFGTHIAILGFWRNFFFEIVFFRVKG